VNIELVDTHVHLDFAEFDADREDVLRRAKEVDVTRFVNVGVDLDSSRKSVALAEQHDCVYAAVGVHPHDAKTATPKVIEEIRALLGHPKVVAIGEIGLDYHRDYSPREMQRQVFREFIRVAKESGQPVIVHTRNAWDDVMKILREENGSEMQGVFHCFSGDSARAQELIAKGFHISFTGVITFKNSRAVELLEEVSLERLLLETDCPFMAPVPHRGRRNEPGYVRLIAQKVAEVKKVTVAEVADATTANALRLFGMGSH
jgi:TatD DNase family protein